MKAFLSVVIIALAMSLTSCSSISDEAHYSLAKPINCSTANQDLMILEQEQASVARQLLAGVTSVLPTSAALGVITGDYPDRVSVATGEYNSQLESKIRVIKQVCGV